MGLFGWHKGLAKGQQNAEDDEGLGRPITATTGNVEEIHAVVRNDRSLNIQMIPEMVNVEK